MKGNLMYKGAVFLELLVFQRIYERIWPRVLLQRINNPPGLLLQQRQVQPYGDCQQTEGLYR